MIIHGKRLEQRILKLETALGFLDIPPMIIVGTRDDGITYLACVMGLRNAPLEIWEHGRGVDPSPLLLWLVQQHGYQIERRLIDGQDFCILLDRSADEPAP